MSFCLSVSLCLRLSVAVSKLFWGTFNRSSRGIIQIFGIKRFEKMNSKLVGKNLNGGVVVRFVFFKAIWAWKFSRLGRFDEIICGQVESIPNQFVSRPVFSMAGRIEIVILKSG